MKKLITLFSFVPILLFGQTTPTMRQVASSGTSTTKLPSVATTTVTTTDTMMVFKSGAWKKTTVSAISSGGGAVWLLNGNTIGSEKWIGTADNYSFPIRTNNTERMIIDSLGRVGIGTGSPSTLLHVGLAGTTKGTFGLAGNTSGLVTIQPLAAAGTYTLTLPPNDGTASQFLQTDGAGVLTFATPTAGWALTGNAGINEAVNFLGTTTNHQLKFKVNNLNAGQIDTSGGLENNFFGFQAGDSITTGNWNEGFGKWVMRNTTTGSVNTGMGQDALYSNKSGSNNIAIGHDAMYSNTTGGQNTVMGVHALYSNTTSSGHTAIGHYAAQALTSGTQAGAFGNSALYAVTTGNVNTGLGAYAGYNISTGHRNTCVGVEAGAGNSSDNTAVGTYALAQIGTTGGNNTAIGSAALNKTTSGLWNTATGSQTMYSNTTGGYNTALGMYAAYQGTTGSRNVSLGYYAGFYGNFSDKLWISNKDTYGNAPAQNIGSLIYGDFSAATLDINGKLGVNDTAPSQALDVIGNGLISGTLDVDGVVAFGSSATTNTSRGINYSHSFTSNTNDVCSVYLDGAISFNTTNTGDFSGICSNPTLLITGSSSVTITNAYGSKLTPTLQGTLSSGGTAKVLTNWYGTWISPTSNNVVASPNNITNDNCFGLYIDNGTHDADLVMTNQYALYLASQTKGTNKYGIVSGSGNLNGFGTATPTATLESMGSGTTSATYALKVEDSNADTLLYLRDDSKVFLGSRTATPAAGDAATINAPSGQIVKDASGSTYTITNSLVTTNSLVFLQGATVGLTTGFDIVGVCTANTITITFQTAGIAAAPSANATVNFLVIN